MQGGNRSEVKERWNKLHTGSSGSTQEHDWVVGLQILTELVNTQLCKQDGKPI